MNSASDNRKNYFMLSMVAIFAAISLFFLLERESLTGQNSKPNANRKVSSIAKTISIQQNEKSIIVPQKIEHHQKTRMDLIENINNLVLNYNKQQREIVLKEADKNPIAFCEVAEEFLKELPFDQIEMRNEILGILVDNATFLNTITDFNSVRSAYFEMVDRIVDREMQSAEFVKTTQLDSLSSYQLKTLAHEGSVIEKNGNFLRSSLSTKVVALSLAALNPDVQTKVKIYNQLLSSNVAELDSYSKDSLISIAKELFLLQ